MGEILWLTDAVYLDKDETLCHLFIPGHFVEDVRFGSRSEVIGYGNEWIVIRWNDDEKEETYRGLALENFKIVGIR